MFGGVARNTYFIRHAEIFRSLIDSGALHEVLLGFDKDFPATRASFKMNFKGPSINVQTACSTSGVAIHLACQSLLFGECDMAIAGGARVQVPLKGGYLYAEGGILSPDGNCRAFDEKAKGTVIGSGVGMVVVRRLADALRDGDYIYAVIKGSAVNNDGAEKVGFTAPSVKGQAAVIEEALAVAGVDADRIDYIEAHGTATTLGDPIEISALTKAFRRTTYRKGYCAIGSVKSNIGHLDAGACVVGVIKTALALKHRLIPPSINFERPNPQIDFVNSPFYVNTRLQEWKKEGSPRRAGVSSFGLGGTNVHIILEEAPELHSSRSVRSWKLLALSAKTPSASQKRLRLTWLPILSNILMSTWSMLPTHSKPGAEPFLSAESSSAGMPAMPLRPVRRWIQNESSPPPSGHHPLTLFSCSPGKLLNIQIWASNSIERKKHSRLRWIFALNT